MRRLSIARSVRLALLGLTLVLAALAGIGVASLYSARQRYEDRLAGAYAVQAAGSNLLAAAVAEQATLRALRGPIGAAERRRARAAFALAALRVGLLAAPDPPSARLVAQAVAAEAALRRRPPTGAAPLAPRAPFIALDQRQQVRRDAARAQARADSRRALAAVIVGGVLALIVVLALVSGLIARMREPLDQLVRAARRLADGDLDARVEERGPLELRSLAAAFNSMADDLASALGRLEAERQRLELTIESLGDALLVVDRDGTIAAANPRAAELLPELRPGARDVGSLPSLESALAGEVTLERDGRTLAATAARFGENDRSVVWTIRDVTERARLEQLKSEFVATASHELRSPLTSIKGFVELLSRSTNLDAKQREFVEIVLVSTDRLVDLANDLLDVARIEAGQVELHRRPADLSEIVDEVVALMGPRLEEKRQTLAVAMPAQLPPALADPGRVRQILMNLLTNAHLYTGEGGRLKISVNETPDALELAVSDDGPGIDDDQLGRIFERFYRGPGGSRAHGSGLGLAIVKSLVDMHGGTIDVRSQQGHGTTFIVWLPRAAELDERAAARHALRGKRVLVIDDEPEVGRLIAARLEPFGVSSEVVTSGEQGVARMRDEHFDAVTLDILMPGMSGFDVLRAIRADPELREIAVVVVSVFSAREALSGEWVVSKPIDADELADALGAAVQAGRARVLVVGRGSVRERLAPTLDELGLEHEWATSAAGAARLCAQRPYEVALVDAGLPNPADVLDALALRGRRSGRSVIVFSTGDESPGLARLEPEPIPIEDAAAAVISLLASESEAVGS